MKVCWVLVWNLDLLHMCHQTGEGALFAFLLLGQQFSLQSRRVQRSRGSAAGWVLPPAGRERELELTNVQPNS